MKILYKIPILRTFLRTYSFTKFRKEWRKRNPHNRTVPMNEFPIERVSIGNHTYGELHILSYLPEVERLSIGHYVSIAPNVHFILSGNHQTSTLFTYPLKSSVEGKHCREDSLSKGEIKVEDEVWIGYGATVMSGVTIGKGSIIGAGSVVTKDIPPYAIACGNPAKVIRYRLAQDIMDEIKDIRLNNLSETQIKSLLTDLYHPLHTLEDAQNLRKKISDETTK